MAHIPGTFERGDQVCTRDRSRTGTVDQDNRRTGGQYVWVKWDDDNTLVCEDAADLRSTQT